MEEEDFIPPSTSSHYKNTNSSSAIRFLGILKQPDSDSNPNSLELDESDIVWSSSDFSDSDPNPVDPIPLLESVNSNFSSNRRNPFRPEKFGLSALLSDDHPPLVQRNLAMNFSARSAGRNVIPVPLLSGSSSEEFSGPNSGNFPQSAPVNVPVWSKGNSEKLGFYDEEDGFMDEDFLPPHVIVARSQVTTFSVFEGVGRTLKGRDLRRVRNAVWRKTGFLD
ncbi:uncharacterized protein LOC143887291 [Tasmannia lanceolata]|uniref:uncharacterized protein LOC143887291 n=1 Tax=Tasmannia lanceolata TaxID=3420 RepID=UPI004062D6B6